MARSCCVRTVASTSASIGADSVALTSYLPPTKSAAAIDLRTPSSTPGAFGALQRLRANMPSPQLFAVLTS
jgi:hypothetical protein